MSAPFAFVDYRRDNAISVMKLDAKTFSVTLKFFLKLVDDEDDSTDRNTLLKEWCSEWNPKDLSEYFNVMYIVEQYSWICPGVIEMVIKTDHDMTEQDVKRDFLSDPLEDSVYEGDPDNSFWIIPEK